VEGHSSARVLEHLNVLMRQLIPDETATVCVLTLDPSTGEARIANAGHPSPLLIHGDTVTC
jgi:serine phosphatase RsbU (regulator of sigma subunit)